MTRDELMEILRESLVLDVKTDSVYTGGMDSPLYRESKTVALILDGEVISEVSI